MTAFLVATIAINVFAVMMMDEIPELLETNMPGTTIREAKAAGKIAGQKEKESTERAGGTENPIQPQHG